LGIWGNGIKLNALTAIEKSPMLMVVMVMKMTFMGMIVTSIMMMISMGVVVPLMVICHHDIQIRRGR